MYSKISNKHRIQAVSAFLQISPDQIQITEDSDILYNNGEYLGTLLVVSEYSEGGVLKVKYSIKNCTLPLDIVKTKNTNMFFSGFVAGSLFFIVFFGILVAMFH